MNLGIFTQAFHSLRIRNYRLFWFGQLVSVSGSWMQDVALSWLVLSLTDSPVVLGLTMALRFGPALLFSLHGGVLADHLPKRLTVLVAQVVQLVLALTLAILTDTELITVTLIYILATVRGVAEAIEGPTRQTFVIEMVGPADLPNALALNSTLFNGARIVGPAIGAIIISTLGIAACFYINAASFVAPIAGLLAMRTSELFIAPRPPRESSFKALREGFRYARSTPEIVIILIVAGTMGAFGYNFQTLLPLVTKYVLNMGASTLALLTTVMGIGSVMAGVFIAYRGRLTQRLFLGASAVFAVLLALVGVSQWRLVTAGLLLLAGFCGVLFMTSANTRLQLQVPDHLRGRVMGMYILVFIGSTPIGSYLIGFLAEHLSTDDGVAVRGTVFILAGLCAAGVVTALVYARRTASRAVRAGSMDEEGPEEEEGWSTG
ncbi:MAG: MFS transporter [Thermoleophilia bacterium]|nr:MFS transporter [Thermoleophilia bacterium]